MITPVLIDQRMTGADADRLHLADDDDVAVSLDRLLDGAVDRRNGIFENGSAARQPGPLRAAITIRTFQAADAGKLVGDELVVRADDVDSEVTETLHHRPCGRRPVERH